MKSVMTPHSFAEAKMGNIPRSSFDRSHGHKTTFNHGQLIPILVDEVLPGDTHTLNVSHLCRLSTPLAPLMDNIFIDIHCFYCPTRIIWSNFKKFMGERINPSDSTSFLVPTISGTNVANSTSLWDYFGLPTKQTNAIAVNSLPFRAYNQIYNDWYRDENLQNSLTVDLGDGPDTLGNYVIQQRGKRHDYFTSCLPWPQKGNDVTLPLGTTAPVKYSSISGTSYSGKFAQINVNASQITQAYNSATSGVIGSANALSTQQELYADLSTATAATINALRQAFAYQTLLEKDARGGTRYIEIVRSHFGVVSPDGRLQRAEYLGGGTSPVNISAIPQTSATVSGQTPKGSLGAIGTSSNSGIGFTKSFTEHGYIIVIASVRSDVTYQQGLDRMFSRSTRYDFYWPSLAHLGEQAVLNKEIYCKGDANDSLVFGYQERWAEYRYKKSFVSGQFRSNDATPLDLWHLADNYAGLPLLNSSWIQENGSKLDRNLAVNTEPDLIGDFYFRYTSVRAMPMYSVPSIGKL